MAEDRILDGDDPLAREIVDVINEGDISALRELLDREPGMAQVRVDDGVAQRSTLHLVTDWPGQRANAAEMIRRLIDAGCDPNVRCVGPHRETPLHWAASCDDVEAVAALVEHGADLEADGAVIGGLTPLADAVAFGQWRAAHRLVELGAAVSFWQAAALGLTGQIDGELADQDRDTLTRALWSACHGGQLAVAARLVEHGANPEWVGYDGMTCRDIARRSGHEGVVAWLADLP